jgi:DNA-binding CsgD family transcriptional regulator
MEASGVFVMLDATVNTELSDSASSRSGVYLQVNGYGSTDSTMVMYRGASNVGKELGIVPHRKWQLEFHTEDFPDYEAILSRIGKPLHEAYGMTPLFTLRGTSEKTVLMTVPIYGPDGHFWGICGYEMRQSYFMSSRAQISKLPRLICLMAPKVTGSLEAGMGLGCGVKSGYYPEPDGSLAMRSFGGGLLLLSGNGQKYIGYTHDVTISPNNDAYTLAVMIPKADYDREFNRALLKNVLIWVALIVAAGNCCLIFSRHYLKPILKGLEALKSADRGESVSSVPEIQDLFRFLAEQDRQNEKTKVELEREMLDARDEVRRLHLEYEQTKSAYLQAEENYSKAQREIERIERSGKAEVDPEDYQMFLEGLKTLTPTEKKIYQHYLDGKTVKEIVVLSDIKESTLRFHNKNIYSKLGVHSLKQLLQYAELSENPQ